MTTTDIATLTTADAAITTMQNLAATNDWVSVFWDRGWGDSDVPIDISIIVDGNGQQPKARITAEVYDELLRRNVIAPNSLVTYKARRVHDFVAGAAITTRTHTTKPSGITEGAAIWHQWTAATDAGSITLSALHTDEHVPTGGYGEPAADGGSWVFNVIASHTPVPSPVWGCPTHEGCDSDAIGSGTARPAWSRIVAAELADDAVYAELEAIHGRVFGEVSAR